MFVTRRVGQALLAGFALLALVGWTGAGVALALECPEPQTAASAGILDEPEAEIDELSRLLASGDVESRISEIIDDLRRKYPSAENAELVNFLVTAYCPVVNAEGISEDAKQAKIGTFSGQVYEMLSR